jgi:hypothetical protein
LELAKSESRPSITFKRDTDAKDLSLIFTVSDCQLPAGAITYRNVDVLPPPDNSDEIEKSFMSKPTVRIRGRELKIRTTVFPTSFDPGTYAALWELSAPRYITTSRTPIALSRSENDWYTPFLLGALAGFASFLWWGLLKKAANKALRLDRSWALLVAVAAIVVGGVNAVLGYLDQDVWTFDDNAKATLVAGFTGGSTGAMAGLLGAVWLQPRRRRRRGAAAAGQPSRAAAPTPSEPPAP